MIRRYIWSLWVILKVKYGFVNLHIDVWLKMVTSTCNSFIKIEYGLGQNLVFSLIMNLQYIFYFWQFHLQSFPLKVCRVSFEIKYLTIIYFYSSEGGMHGDDYYALRWPYDVVENHHNEINHMSRSNLLWADVIILRTKNRWQFLHRYFYWNHHERLRWKDKSWVICNCRRRERERERWRDMEGSKEGV